MEKGAVSLGKKGGGGGKGMTQKFPWIQKFPLNGFIEKEASYNSYSMALRTHTVNFFCCLCLCMKHAMMMMPISTTAPAATPPVASGSSSYHFPSPPMAPASIPATAQLKKKVN